MTIKFIPKGTAVNCSHCQLLKYDVVAISVTLPQESEREIFLCGDCRIDISSMKPIDLAGDGKGTPIMVGGMKYFLDRYR